MGRGWQSESDREWRIIALLRKLGEVKKSGKFRFTV